ncbi:MAG: hypothetical protein J6N72_04760, partial [Psychrobacter sp.]|nr:hypothetical protein [Psychrobacter sp.]
MTDSISPNNSKNLSAQVERKAPATSNIASSTDGSVVNSTEIVSQMRTLIETIKTNNYAYYVLDNPTLEDSEYDQLRRTLLELEEEYPDLVQPDSPINQVGDVPLSAFTQVTHDIPMLSL